MPDAVQASTAPAETSSCELADIFARYGETYEQNHCLTSTQRKVMRAITHIGIAAMATA
jgi:hypothetical protein